MRTVLILGLAATLCASGCAPVPYDQVAAEHCGGPDVCPTLSSVCVDIDGRFRCQPKRGDGVPGVCPASAPCCAMYRLTPDGRAHPDLNNPYRNETWSCVCVPHYDPSWCVASLSVAPAAAPASP